MTKPVYIRKLSIYHYEIPLRTKVFIRGVPFSYKQGLLINFEVAEGNKSWGEISLLPPTEEKINRCIGWIEKNYKHFLGEIDFSFLDKSPEVKFATVSAIDYLNFNMDNLSDTSIKVNALLAGEFNTILEEAERKKNQGYSIFKIKLGEYSLITAINLLNEARKIIGSEAQIVLDLNQQWTLNQTLDLIEQISDKGILYIEDPVKTVAELPNYLNLSPVKAGLDEFLEEWNIELESICKNYLEKIVFIIKPSILYGKEIWQKICTDKSTMKVFTSAWETGIGLRGILNLIFKNRINIEFVGLDTYSYFKYDIVEPLLPIPSPKISLHTLKEKFSIIEQRLKKIHSWEI